MKNRIQWLFALVLMIAVTASCKKEDKKAEADSANLFSGATSKTWEISRMEDAGGDKEKMSSAEKDESLVFYNNGTFVMTAANGAAKGNWTYAPAQEKITLESSDLGGAMAFTILSLNEDKVEIQNEAGEKMTLKAK